MRYSASVAQLALIFTVLLTGPGHARADQEINLLLNGGAEQGQNGQPSVWRAAQVEAEGLRMWQDTEHAHTGGSCLAISNKHAYDRHVSNNWAQDVQDIPRGKLVRLTASIKTRDAENANVCFQCWSAQKDKLVAFGSTPVFRGTNEWNTVHSEEVLVPAETSVIVVRAALTGTGEAFFDDLALSVLDAPMSAPVDTSLDSEVNGRIVRVLPVTKDAMIISYIPNKKFGTWDYTSVANNKSGVRTLLSFESPSANEITQPHLKFFLALLARKTTYSAPAGHIEAHEVLNEWNEHTCTWQEQPPLAPEPVTRIEMTPCGECWKLFDVTGLIRRQAESGRRNYGVVLKFEEENRSAERKTWSGYQFVSREGVAPHRPVLLVIDPTRPPDSRPAEAQPASASQPATRPFASGRK